MRYEQQCPPSRTTLLPTVGRRLGILPGGRAGEEPRSNRHGPAGLLEVSSLRTPRSYLFLMVPQELRQNPLDAAHSASTTTWSSGWLHSSSSAELHQRPRVAHLRVRDPFCCNDVRHRQFATAVSPTATSNPCGWVSSGEAEEEVVVPVRQVRLDARIGGVDLHPRTPRLARRRPRPCPTPDPWPPAHSSRSAVTWPSSDGCPWWLTDAYRPARRIANATGPAPSETSATGTPASISSAARARARRTSGTAARPARSRARRAGRRAPGTGRRSPGWSTS